MSTAGVEAVFLTTHNWGRAAGFFQSLGFELEFATDHDSPARVS
jgi:N-acetylglutamate synthase-like GNAT family acetyltransferase